MSTVGDYIGKDIKVKLGAKDGSAFVFCGNLADIDICDVDETIRNNYMVSLENAKKAIKNLSAKDRSYTAYEREMKRKLKKALTSHNDDPEKIAEDYERFTPSNLGYHKWTADISRKLEYNKSLRRRVNKRLNEYTSIADREILEVYRSIDETDAMIILYDGKEHGWAWTTKEYLNGSES